jgi:hypothetical protein
MQGVTNKMEMIRKIAYNYPKTFKGNYGQVRDVIIIEATWLGYFEPHSKRVLNTYIHDMMIATNQTTLAEEYNLLPFKALVLDSRRTFCEKIMSLVRFSHTETPIVDLNAKIRHIYDIHQLLKDKAVQVFFTSNDFDTMLLKVANDDVISFKNNNEWLQYHPKEALIFKSPEETWNQLKDTYQNDFKFLIYGELPNEKNVVTTIIEVSNRLESVKWELNF